MTRTCYLAFLCAFLAVASPAMADRVFSEKDVRGNYAFSFDGQIVGVGPVAASGRITADGDGNITDAVRTLVVTGVAIAQTFTCALTVNPDGTGSAVCPLDSPAPGAPAVETFDFVIEENGRAFRLVGTTPGIVVLGGGRKQ